MTERFRRTDFGPIELAMTFDDPKTYVRPWTINVAVTFLPDTDLLETVCLENVKDRERLHFILTVVEGDFKAMRK